MRDPSAKRPRSQRHSFSRIRTFAECELRYAHEALAPWKDTPATRRGSTVHAAIEWHLKGLGSLEDAAGQFASTELPEVELREWLRNVEWVFEHIEPLQLEFWAELQLPGCAWPLVGKVDVLSRGAPGVGGECLIDWKTLSDMGRIQYAYDTLQGRVYALLTGVRQVAFVNFTRYHRARVTQCTYTAADLEITRLWLARQCATIEARWESGGWSLSGNPGRGLCSAKWCPVWAKCIGETHERS